MQKDGVLTGRVNNFDLLRLLLAVMVAFSHAYAVVGTDQAPDLLNRLTHGQTNGGEMGVNFFFLISGLLVTNSWIHSRGLLDYFKRRALRIYPGFVGACLFCAFVVGPLCAADRRTYFASLEVLTIVPRLLIFHLPNLPAVLPNVPLAYNINASLWTIRSEFMCYGLVAMLGLLGLYRRRIIIPALFALAFTAFILINLPGAWLPHTVNAILHAHVNWPRLLTYFLAGMVGCLYADRVPYHPGMLAASVALLLTATLTGALFWTLPLWGSYILLYLAFRRPLGPRAFWRRADLSYGIYLYHFPVEQFFMAYLGRMLSPAMLFLLAFPFVCGLAWLSWRWIEKPSLQLKRLALRRRVRLPEAA